MSLRDKVFIGWLIHSFVHQAQAGINVTSLIAEKNVSKCNNVCLYRTVLLKKRNFYLLRNCFQCPTVSLLHMFPLVQWYCLLKGLQRSAVAILEGSHLKILRTSCKLDQLWKSNNNNNISSSSCNGHDTVYDAVIMTLFAITQIHLMNVERLAS